VLQGGGALGAYEVGAVKAIIEHITKDNDDRDKHVFDVVAGSSIGAINGSLLIGQFLRSNSWKEASQKLEDYWKAHISSDNAFVDNIPAFAEWWDYWSKTSNGTIASTEAA
jgi:predicted acylesterase/phospholipase RssA